MGISSGSAVFAFLRRAALLIIALHCGGVTAIVYWSEIKNTAEDHCTGKHCVIPSGEVFILDSNLHAKSLTINGVLKWDATFPDLEIRTSYVLVSEGGYFKIGSRNKPMMHNATVYITKAAAEEEDHKHDIVGYRFLASHGQDSRIDIHGRPLDRTWTLLERDAWPGTSQIFVKHDPVAMGWRVGDRIGIATTDRGNSTVARIQSISLASEWQLPLRKVGRTRVRRFTKALSATAVAGDAKRWGHFCQDLCLGRDQYLVVHLKTRSNVTRLRVQFDELLFAPKYRVEVLPSPTEHGQWVEATVVANAGGGWQEMSIDHLSSAITAVRLFVEPSGLEGRSSGKEADMGVFVREIQVFGSEVNGPRPNTLHLDAPLQFKYWGGHRTISNHSFEMAAEVVNLERSVVITGDHREEDVFDGEGIHTGMFGKGTIDIRYARVEHCGQRKKHGRYCMHLNDGGHCVECSFQGNAIVDSRQVGIAIDQTHRALVDSNIIWDAAGAGIYVRAGNEMHNVISNNVAVCSVPGKCTVDWLHGSDNAGIYMIGMTNDLIENRIIGYDNGIWAAGTRAPWGTGAMEDKVCPVYTPFGAIRGNVNHDNRVYGVRLGKQYPRNLKRNTNGILTEKGSCSEFNHDGSDNGLTPANVVEGGFDWHNMYVGQLGMGDVSIRDFKSVNNKFSLLWKESKNFADGKSWHIEDSVFANDATDPFGRIQVLGPGGALAFLIRNTSFLGGPTDFGALTAGYQCGRVNASGPCAVQFHLHNVSFSGLRKSSQKIKFGAFGSHSSESLPIFTSDDDSLGGHRSMVSRHLAGFENDPGCKALSWRYDSAIGCADPIRRFRVKTKRDLGNLTLTGPGYGESPNMTAPVNGGILTFEDNMNTTIRGYSAPVFSKRKYHVSGAWRGDVVFEFADYPDNDWLNISYAGQSCNLVSQPHHKETMFGVEICELRDAGVESDVFKMIEAM